MSKELLRTRIGNTVTVVLPVLTRGDAVSLVGRDITIMLVDPNDVKTPVSFTVGGVDNNIATFVVEGTSQSATGTYRAEVYENYRGTAMAVYDCDIFVLVARTEYENDGNEGVSSETTTLDPINIAWVGRDGYTPYIQDGYWYINGTSTNVKAAGENGDTPYIENGYWYIGGVSTGIKVDYTNEEAQRAAAEQVRVVAEAARVQAEAARTLAENSRLTEESGRSAAEGVRILAERDRQAAETTRQTQEEIRHDNEEARVEAELGRAASEASRAQVEATRVANESARTTAEATRAANEQTRVAEETDRAAAETARIAAETARETAEDGRASAEATRVSNEQTRVSNETTRQSNESARQSAETARQAAYVAAENARDAAFAEKEATRDAANQAALDCADTLAALGPKMGQPVVVPIIDTNKYINLSGSIGSTVSMTPTASESGFCYRMIEVSDDDVVIVSGTGGASPRLWGFVDSENKLLSVADSDATATNLRLTAPFDAAKVIINDNTNKVSYVIKTSQKVVVRVSDIVNDLTTGGTNVPVSAEQAKNLNTSVTKNANDLANTHNIGVYANLINPDEVVFGDNLGVSSSVLNTTGFIDVSQIKTSSFSYSVNGTRPTRGNYRVRRIVLYNSSKTQIRNEDFPDFSQPYTFDTQTYSTLAYIKLLLYIETTGGNKADFIANEVQLSPTATIEPYGYGSHVELKSNVVGTSQIKNLSITTEKIGNGQVTSAKIGSQQITPDKTNFFNVFKNLFNPTNCTYNNAWGNSSTYHTTGLIDVSDYHGKTLRFSYNNGDVAVVRQMKVFNAAQQDITYSGGYATEAQQYIAYKSTWVIPNDVYYIKLCVGPTYLDANNETKMFQVEAGDSIHPYMPYGNGVVRLKPEYIEGGGYGSTNVAQLTSKLYLTDKRVDLFFSPMFKNWQHIGNRFCRVSATGATIYRQFKDLVTIDATANGKLTFKTYDDSFNVIDTKEVTTVFTSQSKTGSIKVLWIGSSITSHGIILNKLSTWCGEGFESVGTRHRQAYPNLYFEGVGGFGLADFSKYYKSATTPTSPFWHPTSGRYWGVVGYWKNVMTKDEWDSTYNGMLGRKTAATAAGFGSDGYISGSRLQTNDIMYDDTLGYFVQWNGSAWSRISEPATWGFDFVKYGEMWNISAPDVFVMAELSTNDFRNKTSTPNFTSWNANAEAMIAALKVWNNSINVVMAIPISTFGGDCSLGEFVQSCNYRMYESRLNQIEHFDNREDENIYLIDDAIFFDEMYGYSVSTNTDMINPNQEYTGDKTLTVQLDSPHPNAQGEYLLAAGFFGIIQYLRG